MNGIAKTHTLVPILHFNPDGSKARCSAEGGYYIFAKSIKKPIAEEIIDIYENNKCKNGLSLYDTLMLIYKTLPWYKTTNEYKRYAENLE